MLKKLLDELVVEYENTQIMPKNLIEKMHNILISDQSKNESIKLKHHIVQLILSYYVNEQQPNITEQYAYQYLQMENWTSKQEAVIYAKLGASLTDMYYKTKDPQLLSQAEEIFRTVIDSNILSGKLLREAKRNLCTNIRQQKNPNKYFELLKFSYFYDVAEFFYQLNQYNKDMFCTCQFREMVKNDYDCPIDELFLNEIPDKLYKYRSFDKEHYSVNLIINSNLYLSETEHFNDPFDPPLRAYNEYEKLVDILFPHIVVGSLSAVSNNILMWSHYADSHKGFCIEYDVSNLKKELPKYTTIRQVRYENSLPIDLKVLFNTDEYFHSILDMCALKHKDWEYEKEYRILSHQDDDFITLPITAIYLGKDISDSNKLIIHWLCSSRNIPVYQYIADPKNMFTLIIDK